MARNITAVKAQEKTSGTHRNPYFQACFSIFSFNHSDGGGGFFTYDHSMNMINCHRGDDQSYGSYRAHGNGASEFFDNWAGHTFNRTQHHSHTSDDRFDGTNNVGYLGHQYCIQGSGNGGSSQPWIKGWSGANDYTPRAFRYVGAIVNEIYQDYAIFGEHNGHNTLFIISDRNSTSYYHYRHHTHHHYTNIPTVWTDGGQAYGCNGAMCYNKKTKQLVIMERRHNESYRHKPTVYNNCPDLRTMANQNLSYRHKDTPERYNAYSNDSDHAMRKYIADATTNGWIDTKYVQTNNIPHTGYGEIEWRGVPVICDNEKLVWMQMLPHHGFWAFRWNADGSEEGRILNLSWTTSYGSEHGPRWGIRWQVTSDGRYLFAYCPGYYWGAAIMGACVRVSDGKVLYEQHNDSTYGYQLAPMGKNNWFCCKSVNTDGGPGLYHTCHDTEWRFATQNDLGHFHSHHNWLTQMHDTAYYSTSYPGIIPMQYDTSLFSTQLSTADENGDFDVDHTHRY